MLTRMTDPLTARRINRAHWDALAAAHGQDDYYDTEALVGGKDSLGVVETAGVREAVGAVAGLDVLHLQCHIGFDSISLARRGARVVGADFSARLAREGARAGAPLRGRRRVRRGRGDRPPGRAAQPLRPRVRDDRRDLLDRRPARVDGLGGGRPARRRPAAARRHPPAVLHGRRHRSRCASTSRTRSTARARSRTRARTRARTCRSPRPPTSTTRIRSARSSTRRSRRACGSSASTSTSSATSTRAASVLAREEDGRFRLRGGGELLPVLFTLVAAKP